MKTIIRIEHNNGIGCFQQREHLSLDQICPEATERHFTWPDMCTGQSIPTPGDDVNLYLHKDNKEWFCAFKSLDQLNMLFQPHEIQIIIKAGYKILLLDVSEYQESPNQVLYTKESIINTKVINSLFIK